METMELNRIWGQIKAELIAALPENAHPWVNPLQISDYDNGILTVVTGQLMGRDFLRKNHYNQIVEILKNFSGNPKSDFVIVYDESAAKLIKKESEKLRKKAAEAEQREKAIENLPYMQSSANLNLKYKFENFVVGESNRFAYTVAKAVAENPAKKYNPLFIYGASGVGKTHLMQAIGHYIIFKTPKLRVKYTKIDDYIADFISNSRSGKDSVENMSKFNKKYTNIDIILIDDIQFIEGKKKTMDQMHHTFESLYQKGKQVVITSDRLPKDIPSLSAALCTRFEMGLMVEILRPDDLTRLNILKKLAGDIGLECEPDALEFIAKNNTNNVRELEGAFNKVSAYAEMTEQPVTLELVRRVFDCEADCELGFDEIAEVTAQYYNVSLKDLKGAGRTRQISNARQIAIYLTREITHQSLVSIADYYKRRHSTIVYAYETVRKNIKNSELSKAVREIKQVLKLI